MFCYAYTLPTTYFVMLIRWKRHILLCLYPDNDMFCYALYADNDMFCYAYTLTTYIYFVMLIRWQRHILLCLYADNDMFCYAYTLTTTCFVMLIRWQWHVLLCLYADNVHVFMIVFYLNAYLMLNHALTFVEAFSISVQSCSTIIRHVWFLHVFLVHVAQNAAPSLRCMQAHDTDFLLFAVVCCDCCSCFYSWLWLLKLVYDSTYAVEGASVVQW